MTYALDTNIIIHLLRGTQIARDRRDEVIRQGNNLIVPPFVDYEMQRGFLCNKSQGKEKSYKTFCSIFSVGEMNADIWKRGAEIYFDLWQRRLTIGDSDILIAAFCMIGGYILVTDNTKHFAVINSLQFENWI